jgi:hypothetical protein
MDITQATAVGSAGLVAGIFTAVVGAGTLITFPVMLAVGYSPVIANVSTDVGLVPGSVSSAFGFRRELAGQSDRLRRLGLVSMVGAIVGALLLLKLPPAHFRTVAPILVALSVLLVVFQPRLTSALARREREGSLISGVLLLPSVFCVALYGGYFGGGQGVLAFGVLAVLIPDTLHRVNALKVVLVLVANSVSAGVFVLIGEIAWPAVVLIAAGSLVGGYLGARIGGWLSPPLLRVLVVLVGVAAIVKLAW